MAQYTEVHHHDSGAAEAAGLSATMIMLIAVVVIALGAGLFWWQPWAGPTTRSETTIVQPAPVRDAPDTTIVNPPSNNTTIVNPPSEPPTNPNGGG